MKMELPSQLSPVPILQLTIFITIIKFLLIPSYRSTDFDVHRNWLAITRHLPLSEWYFDDVNGGTVHTLDYPPSFAYFEYLLSNNALTNYLVSNKGVLEERCLELLPDDDNSPSDACVMFQRCTVILFDGVLLLGAVFAAASICANTNPAASLSDRKNKLWATIVLIVANPGLLLLDHIHFQYNGMMLGLLLGSIGCICQSSSNHSQEKLRGNWLLLAAILYGVLITMKHLYITLAPLYFVYFLRHYCFVNDQNSSKPRFSPIQFLRLALVTGGTILLPFLPFFVYTSNPTEQWIQILHRLFPFQRGLCHDYWAANVWALYLFADKLFRFVSRKLAVLPLSAFPDGFPDVPPSVTALLLVCCLIPALVYALRSRVDKRASNDGKDYGGFFVHAVVYSSLSAFMVSYHVHEKAIMTSIIPMTLLATKSRDHARLFIRLATFGHFGLLPLLFQPREMLFKGLNYGLFLLVSVTLLRSVEDTDAKPSKEALLTRYDYGTWVVLSILFLFNEVVYPLLMKPRFEFLPLLLISVTCAIGLTQCWIESYRLMKESVP